MVGMGEVNKESKDNSRLLRCLWGVGLRVMSRERQGGEGLDDGALESVDVRFMIYC